jgi:hypothetical protein
MIDLRWLGVRERRWISNTEATQFWNSPEHLKEKRMGKR